MQNYKVSLVIGILTIICCTDMCTMGYTVRRQKHRMTLKPERELTEKLMTDIPEDLMEKIKRNLDKNIKLSSPNSNESITKSNNKRYGISGMTKPSNRRNILLYNEQSRNVVKMKKTGVLLGTRNFHDPDAVFVIESMKRGVVRLKGKRANKYICINEKGKIVVLENSQRGKPDCFLRQYLEENYNHLFWSYPFSSNEKGENGWFLALKKNGKKMRKPLHTRLGDRETMFQVHFLNDSTFKVDGS
ncbi:fibroblast growth factor 17-like isoform X2 [Hydractinia symbiolongicarpus]|uniref:fibroblast growth factor 17-like isoform X2 n=1 Tax=Hydractinia symbiolongicarpus TaxID=13093 RepID=UPI00254C24A1|nr:fibroblast growth factor 17-like isoform X2 [Hydractinia symbiolongicarpus]